MISDEIVMSTEVANGEDSKDGKRTKWQPPPSHHALLSSATRKSKVSIYKSYSRDSNNMKSNSVQHMDSEAVGDSDFNAVGSDPGQRFAKATIGHSYEEILNVLTSPKSYRQDSIARADICPKIRRPRLQHTKGLGAKVRDQYGYDISNTTYLFAEEALYLIEIGKLELYLHHVRTSVERARALLLHSKSHPEAKSTKVKTCSVDDYLVYKHLSKQGYRLRRRDQYTDVKLECNSVATSPDDLSPLDTGSLKEMEVEISTEVAEVNNTDETGMDFDESGVPKVIELPGIENNSAGCMDKRGVKRKFNEVCGSQTTGSITSTSSAKDISDDDDADIEFEFVSGSGDVCMDSTSESHTFQQGEGYMVTEADSDVEIIDAEEELAPTGVSIEEIGYDYDGDIEEDTGCKREPQPSTSAACCPPQGVVHLVESDSDTEEEIKSFSKVWNKFVPNATIQIGFPPQVLLPKNIPSRSSIFELDLKNKEGQVSDSELEYYVDELNLNSSPGETDNEYDQNSIQKRKKHDCKSWKDWKLQVVNEAKDVMKDSLLADSLKSGYCEDAMKKLYLWENQESETKKQTEGWKNFNIAYDLYHPSVGLSAHKSRLKRDFQPCYAVAIVRNDEELTSFSNCEPTLEGIPILIALVSDESDIIFMNPDRSPVPSLF